MAGHSRPKDGVASLAYVPAISMRLAPCVAERDAQGEPAHDGGSRGANQLGITWPLAIDKNISRITYFLDA
jgi:hypothetical protein